MIVFQIINNHNCCYYSRFVILGHYGLLFLREYVSIVANKTSLAPKCSSEAISDWFSVYRISSVSVAGHIIAIPVEKGSCHAVSSSVMSTS